MKFLCLICAEKVMEQMPEADAEKHYQEYAEFTDAIRRSGHFIGCNRLLPAGGRDHGAGAQGQGLDHRRALRRRPRNSSAATTSSKPGTSTRRYGWPRRSRGHGIGCVEVRPIAEDAQTLRALGLAAAVNCGSRCRKPVAPSD